jgi:hypothetical protein
MQTRIEALKKTNSSVGSKITDETSRSKTGKVNDEQDLNIAR